MSEEFLLGLNQTKYNITTNDSFETINQDEMPDKYKILMTIKISALIVITAVTFIFGFLPLIW